MRIPFPCYTSFNGWWQWSPKGCLELQDGKDWVSKSLGGEKMSADQENSF